MARFRKHADSPAHRTATAVSLASGKVSLPEMEGFCPTHAEWMSVLEHSKHNDTVLLISQMLAIGKKFT